MSITFIRLCSVSRDPSTYASTAIGEAADAGAPGRTPLMGSGRCGPRERARPVLIEFVTVWTLSGLDVVVEPPSVRRFLWTWSILADLGIALDLVGTESELRHRVLCHTVRRLG